MVEKNNIKEGQKAAEAFLRLLERHRAPSGLVRVRPLEALAARSAGPPAPAYHSRDSWGDGALDSENRLLASGNERGRA